MEFLVIQKAIQMCISLKCFNIKCNIFLAWCGLGSP